MFISLVTLLYLTFYKPQPKTLGAQNVVLGTRSFSLEDRYDNKFVSDIFKDNILLTVRYMAGEVKNPKDIVWSEVEKPFHYEFSLKPGEEFAFHDGILPKYKNVVKTTNAHFIGGEGFKSDGYLIGDGVCHLASLTYWAAKDAGLDAYAPSNHNFAKINDVPKEYGVAIMTPSPLGNLYITNNLDKPVTFAFDYNGTVLSVIVTKNI